MLDRSVLKISMTAGARIAAGRGALIPHRELARQLDPVSMFAYGCALAIAISQSTHERRANAIANAIIIAGTFLTGEPIYDQPARELVEYEIVEAPETIH